MVLEGNDFCLVQYYPDTSVKDLSKTTNTCRDSQCCDEEWIPESWVHVCENPRCHVTCVRMTTGGF
jgi:hypothetical protein